MRFKTGGLALLTILAMLISCGGENSITAINNQPDKIFISRDIQGGTLLIKSSDGHVYDFAFLEKVLDGETNTQIILVQSENITVQAAPPKYPISNYITNVIVWGNGVSVQLTWDGFMLGLDYIGALTLADWTIQEYQRQSGKSWPYHKRSKASIANEIQTHCWLIFGPLWKHAFPIDMGFDEWYW